jgi:flavin-dependent thymidylate synthase
MSKIVGNAHADLAADAIEAVATGKTVQKWADSAMFTAEPIAAEDGPKVYLLSMTPDPLGTIAAACKGYEGKFVHDLSEVTDAEREHYFAEVQKTHLKAPMEFVQFHFLIEGVTRGFTHQMVRQRMATYVQESTRFAVKEDMPVALPPSLAGTEGGASRRVREAFAGNRLEFTTGPDGWEADDAASQAYLDQLARVPANERQREQWDAAVKQMGQAYKNMVDAGMPAEDARGLLPTNLLTRIQYRTDLRALLEHGGNRLCTQAQFEWRTVFAKIVEAIRSYDPKVHPANGRTSRWQFEKLSNLFRPICYLTGKCEFKANFDRKCSIRERVDANASINRPSSEWDKQFVADRMPNPVREPHAVELNWPWATTKEVEGFGRVPDRPIIPAIRPAEWLLDPGAAR